MNSELKQATIQPTPLILRYWNAYRRPAFLVLLLTALVLFLFWLPNGAVSALFTALIAQRALVGLFLLFALTSLSMLWSFGEEWDSKIFLFFNLWSYHPKWLDGVMWLATQLGNFVTALILSGTFFILGEHRLPYEMLLGTFTQWLLVEVIKSLSNRTRPFLTLKGARLIGWRERGRSFPSGHTAQTFFIITLLTHWFQLGLAGTIALYSIGVLVGFTRIYIGVHYPRDVIGGAILGSIWGILAILIDPFWSWLSFW